MAVKVDEESSSVVDEGVTGSVTGVIDPVPAVGGNVEIWQTVVLAN